MNLLQMHLNKDGFPGRVSGYNERSTRINLSEYSPSKTTKKLSKRVIVQAGNVAAEREKYSELYEKYCDYHGFKRDISLSSFEDCSVIEYWDGDLVGISLYKTFNDQFVGIPVYMGLC
jgi:arginyl-tRNA--protein-N-Asp/Glu arginylyltransferase